VTSTCQRRINHWTISIGAAFLSVHNSAWGWMRWSGSWIKTQRRGTVSLPAWCHTAVPEAIGFTLPVRDDQALPMGRWISSDLLQGGEPFPFLRGHPERTGHRGRAGSYNAASNRSRVTTLNRSPVTAAKSSKAEKL